MKEKLEVTYRSASIMSVALLTLCSLLGCSTSPSAWKTHRLYEGPDLPSETATLLVDPIYHVTSVDGKSITESGGGSRLLLPGGTHTIGFRYHAESWQLSANLLSGREYAIGAGVLPTGYAFHVLLDLTNGAHVVPGRIAEDVSPGASRMVYDDGQESPMKIEMPNMGIALKATLYTKGGSMWVRE